MIVEPATVDENLKRLGRRLLASRTRDCHWEGTLSSSALSTATAVVALGFMERKSSSSTLGVDRRAHREMIAEGLEWLAKNQNEDGGWGDTVLSFSNISTTALCWAAFSASEARGQTYDRSTSTAESWLCRAAGGLDPQRIVDAIVRRYGKDRTFSVPILTVLGLTGRLGSKSHAWRWVPQLPFELAALPQRWFKWLRLPVVSYALPALIALGLVRHHHRPSRNPLARLVRQLAIHRTLRVLRKIQPSNGGFLEAIPLTSFVVMSLVAGGRSGHPVAQRGLEFLIRSVREDGSWPIDTNLATWVTTLSVNALTTNPSLRDLLSLEERQQIRDWLLAQQCREEHPYTLAAAGGWAWTDRPGAVPDADDTSGALLALKKLELTDEPVRKSALAGVRWLLGLQNRDGGMPTFCRGWGRLDFDRSSPDLTAHALLAWSAWCDEVPSGLRHEMMRAMQRAVRYLEKLQRDDGSWVPLWFGNQSAPGEENPTVGTARVVAALGELGSLHLRGVSEMTERGVQWLVSNQNPDEGWGGAREVASSVEETGLALHALAVCGRRSSALTRLRPSTESDIAAEGTCSESVQSAIGRGTDWLIKQTSRDDLLQPSPIGLYFARLWYFENLYPLIFAVAALSKAQNLFCTANRSSRSITEDGHF